MAVRPSGIRVLVVEDDDRLLAVLVEMLRDAGHAAAGVLTGKEAVARVRTASYDVALCDVQLADMRADALALILRETRPTLRLVFMSGWGEQHLAGWKGLPPEKWLRKPFTLHELETALRA